MIEIYCAIIVLFTFMLFFFSLSETAIVSANRSIILSRKDRGIPFAGSALFILDRSDETLSLILIGSNISSIGATAFITLVATRFYHFNETALLVVTVIQTAVFLLLCEALPKILSRFNADNVIVVISSPLKLLLILFRPIVKGALSVSVLLKSRYHGEKATSSERSRDEINALFRLGNISGLIDETRRTYISEILSLHKINVIEALTPTINIISIEINSSVQALVDLIAKSRFSRIPVYENRVDNIIGYVYYRDIISLKEINSVSIRDLMSQPVYVPLTKSLYFLYREMQITKNYIVFAVNEYGAVVGMVTREDIAEEIVGEIQTRDHHRDELIRKNADGSLMINGSLDIDIFARLLSINIEKKGFETVSGFVSYLAEKIPREGDILQYDGVVITVGKASERKVSEITAKKKKISSHMKLSGAK
jgi:putative hemolysin